MTDTITLKDVTGNTLTTLTTTTASFQVNGSGFPLYNGEPVTELFAYLDSGRMVLNLTPPTGGSALYLSDIDATPSPGETVVTGGATWDTLSGGGLSIAFTTPGTSGHQLDWHLSDEAPPVRLTVKIKRR